MEYTPTKPAELVEYWRNKVTRRLTAVGYQILYDLHCGLACTTQISTNTYIGVAYYTIPGKKYDSQLLNLLIDEKMCNAYPEATIMTTDYVIIFKGIMLRNGWNCWYNYIEKRWEYWTVPI